MNGLLAAFAPHHRELRRRILVCLAAVAVGSVACYLAIDEISALAVAPLFKAYPELDTLVYTKLTEAFIAYLKLSLLGGLFLASPVLLYQAWMFVAPGLLAHERRFARLLLLWGGLLFLGGAAFAFFVVLPRMLTFFFSYAGDTLIPLPKLGRYLTFVGRLLLGFGLAFEIPFLMVTAAAGGLVRQDYFRRRRRFFYISLTVLSFLLAAGDFTATVLLCLPLFGLYEAGILAGRVFRRRSD